MSGPLKAGVAKATTQFDSTGLRYTLRNDQLYVSYPHRSDGHIVYGNGFAVGPVPTTYWTAAPNAITRERAALWAALFANDAPPISTACKVLDDSRTHSSSGRIIHD